MAKKWTQEEIAFLYENYLVMEDKDIAERLGKTERAVSYCRQKHNLQKKSGGTVVNIDESKVEIKNFTKEDKKQMERAKLIKSDDYKMLQSQFSPEELEIYVDKYIDYISDWDSVTPQERDHLHALIKDVLVMNNLMKFIKKQEQISDKILATEEAIEALLDDGIEAEDDEVMTLRSKADSLRALKEPVAHFYKLYKEANERFQDNSRALKSTREQRLKDKEESNLSILTIAQMLNDADKKKQMGDEVAVLNQRLETKRREFLDKEILRQAE